MRPPSALPETIQAWAVERGIPYQQWIREMMEEKVAGDHGPPFHCHEAQAVRRTRHAV